MALTPQLATIASQLLAAFAPQQVIFASHLVTANVFVEEVSSGSRSTVSHHCIAVSYGKSYCGRGK